MSAKSYAPLESGSEELKPTPTPAPPLPVSAKNVRFSCHELQKAQARIVWTKKQSSKSERMLKKYLLYNQNCKFCQKNWILVTILLLYEKCWLTLVSHIWKESAACLWNKQTERDDGHGGNRSQSSCVKRGSCPCCGGRIRTLHWQGIFCLPVSKVKQHSLPRVAGIEVRELPLSKLYKELQMCAPLLVVSSSLCLRTCMPSTMDIRMLPQMQNLRKYTKILWKFTSIQRKYPKNIPSDHCRESTASSLAHSFEVNMNKSN